MVQIIYTTWHRYYIFYQNMVNQIKFILYQTEQQFIAGTVYRSGAPVFLGAILVVIVFTTTSTISVFHH